MNRGHLIGLIVDALISVEQTLEMLNAFGLTDENRFLEDFFCEIMNKVYGLKLVNLNKNHPNYKGLDLGDFGAKIAYQVTSQKEASKIQKMFDALDLNQIKSFNKINVFIIGKKQNSYTTIEKIVDSFKSRMNGEISKDVLSEKNIIEENKKTVEDFTFDERSIISLQDLIKDMIYIDIKKLKDVYDHIENNYEKLKLELKPHDSESTRTELSKLSFEKTELIELKPRKERGKIYHYRKNIIENMSNIGGLHHAVEVFQKLVSNLPKVTRFFLKEMIEKILEKNQSDNSVDDSISYLKLKRLAKNFNVDEELIILQNENLITINKSQEYKKDVTVQLVIDDADTDDVMDLLQFLAESKIDLNDVIVNLNFSVF